MKKCENFTWAAPGNAFRACTPVNRGSGGSLLQTFQFPKKQHPHRAVFYQACLTQQHLPKSAEAEINHGAKAVDFNFLSRQAIEEMIQAWVFILDVSVRKDDVIASTETYPRQRTSPTGRLFIGHCRVQLSMEVAGT